MMMPKASCLPPKLLELLKDFEESIAKHLVKLKPAEKEDVLSMFWLRSAMESLCGIHTEIKVLITELELPVCDWDEKWIDVYLDSSVKLLDICIAFNSEISQLNQGHLFLQSALHTLGSASENQFVKARSSLDGWKQHVGCKNPRLDKCFSAMESLVLALDLPKIKNSSKGKVLMRAMYGVKAVTLFICSAFAAALSGSANKMIDIQARETLWAEAFTDLQTFVNTEIRNRYSNGALTVLEELEAVDASVKTLYPIVQDGVSPIQAEAIHELKSDLETSADQFSRGLDQLAKEVDRFFQVVLTGRDALLGNLRNSGNVSNHLQRSHSFESQAVR
ncbi:protein BPS1, chloroplastic-like isoform X2 [Andrographis paniculata]|nr:protein BPS1, chloroplastic-like isoform X2 [Andrographis paniculata]